MLILDKLQTAKCRQLQMILNYSQADWIMQNIPKKRCQMILKMVRFLTSEKIFQWWTLNYEPIKLLSRSDMSYIKYQLLLLHHQSSLSDLPWNVPSASKTLQERKGDWFGEEKD